MKNIQRLGGYASLLLGFGFITILIIDFAVLAPMGFAGPDTPPELVMALVNTSAIPFQLLDIFSMLGCSALVLTVLALRERMASDAPNHMRLAVIAATIASALMVVVSTADFRSIPILAATNDVSTFRAITSLLDGIFNGGIFAWGWTVFLCGWAGLQTAKLPARLCYLLLLTGILGILTFVITIFGIFVVALNVGWGLWLGYVLLRQPKPIT